MMRIAISVFLSVMILCTAVMTGVSAADNTPALLTVTDVLMINDSQLIIRFSEPAAFNLLGKNRGPYIALRVVDANNRLQYAGGTVPLQYRGRLCFTDSAHDTVLFTYDDGVNDIVSLLRFEGDLAPFAGRGYELKLAIEEVPFDQSSPIPTTSSVCSGIVDRLENKALGKPRRELGRTVLRNKRGQEHQR